MESAGSATPATRATPVAESSGVPVQVAFLKNWNVAVPVRPNESEVVTVAESCTEEQRASEAPTARTSCEPAPVAPLCSSVEVEVEPALTVKFSQELNAESVWL